MDVVLLEGWFQFFFLGVVFFFGGWGVVMLGDFFFVEKKGVHPPKINFSRIERKHFPELEMIRISVLQAPYGLYFLGE